MVSIQICMKHLHYMYCTDVHWQYKRQLRFKQLLSRIPSWNLPIVHVMSSDVVCLTAEEVPGITLKLIFTQLHVHVHVLQRIQGNSSDLAFIRSACTFFTVNFLLSLCTVNVFRAYKRIQNLILVIWEFCNNSHPHKKSFLFDKIECVQI